MSDVAPSKDAFVALMAAAKDPWYTAVIYRAWLEHVDPEEPLWRTPYFGQVVRIGTAENIFVRRKKVHVSDAARENKTLGLHAVIDMFGPDAIEWQIVSSESGRRDAMQTFANAEEIRLIDEHGGILRDMDCRLDQTLNLTKGGQGEPRIVWGAINAWRRRALNKFKAAMEAYVAENGSALVPKAFVNADKYPLGTALSNFRQGMMRKGLPEEEQINAWAEALPKFAWEAHYGQKRSREALVKFKSEMEKYVAECDSALVPRAFVTTGGYKLGSRLNHFRQGQMWKGMPWKDEAVAWAQALPSWAWKAKKTDKWREGCSQRSRRFHKNQTVEKRDARISKIKTTMATDKSKDKRSKVAIALQATQRRAELERARPIAVPFTKSKKRRVEMRAVSKHTKPSGRRGDNVLYMISEDGDTIHRVGTNGCLGKDRIVGPVVDPAPPDAFDSD